MSEGVSEDPHPHPLSSAESRAVAGPVRERVLRAEACLMPTRAPEPDDDR
ncbi:hypothetical protein R3X27_14635 [Tropicimonas sp. TH_r6]|nr:hypothetical protein [Tropicimonas sp. TH_r6]MDV7143921.1 hypothetical protein [Tropicimonas sp. TH_r6]